MGEALKVIEIYQQYCSKRINLRPSGKQEGNEQKENQARNRAQNSVQIGASTTVELLQKAGREFLSKGKATVAIPTLRLDLIEIYMETHFRRFYGSEF